MSKVRVFQVTHEKVRLGAKNCPWSVEWREKGRRRTKTIGTKAEAEDFAKLKYAELRDREAGVTPRKPWQAFVDRYLADMEARGNRPATVQLARIVLSTFAAKVKPRWVSEIDAETLDDFRAKRLQDEGPKGKVSAETVKKELRHLRAALAVAERWRYLREVPSLPRVVADQVEKPHVVEADFLAILKAVDVATLPDVRIHDLAEGATPGDWWRALLVTLWVTGARIGAVLSLRWEDVDWEAGRVLSRAADLKQRKDTRPEASGALPALIKIRGQDPRLLPWNHNRRTLYPEFRRIQEAAGIYVTCPKEGQPGHACRETCRFYGFHAFRYAHARFNYQNPELQNQMGHSCAATTEHYRKWAERQMKEYGAYLPEEVASGDGGEGSQKRKNGGDKSGESRFQVVG